MEFNSIPEAVADLRKGRLIVVVDDKDRENEGDVVFAASKSTAAKINFLAKHARGLICVALTSERVEELRLPPMAESNLSRHDTAFTVSVEVREGTTTGISAADRSATALALADDQHGHEDFIRPGHVFPIKAKKGGVLVRAGHTEAAVDLVKMAGLGSAGVICEIMNEDGSMARLKDCQRFARKHKLKIISVEDLIGYRRTQEKLIRLVASPELPTRYGTFKSYVYEDVIHGRKHIALVKGDISPKHPANVRVHSECLTGDTFGVSLCTCGCLFHLGLEHIAKHGGVFLYMRQVDAEADFTRKIQAYDEAQADRGARSAKPAKGEKAPPRNRKKADPPGTYLSGTHHGLFMDARTYGIGAQILFDLGVRHLHLLTNSPRRIQGLEGYGLKVTRQSPMDLSQCDHGRQMRHTEAASQVMAVPGPKAAVRKKATAPVSAGKPGMPKKAGRAAKPRTAPMRKAGARIISKEDRK
ncbi:MAG: riboflavin biosynthesis cyclohydrolase RibA [Fibrobacteres bacterium]|nr:riboflavin biosynthesis cyclohydrolase RibA [Fibrobacterota bacterium]